MSNFFIGKKVIWKKEECEIVAIEKGKPTKKPDYQNGVLFNGFKNSAKRYVLNTGQKVTGQDLLNHEKHLKENEKCESLLKEAERQFCLLNRVEIIVEYNVENSKSDLISIDNLEGAKNCIRDLFFRKIVKKIIV